MRAIRAEWAHPGPTVWAAAYTAVHAWWAVAGTPAFGASGVPFLPDGWAPAIAGAAATAACVLTGPRSGHNRTVPARWAVVAVGWTAGAALIVHSLLFWIGITMVLMTPFGLPMTSDDVAAVGMRAAGSGAGALTLWAMRAEFRRARSACDRCGRVHGRSPDRRSEPAPWWAYLAGYLAVAGLVTRLTPAFLLDGGITQGPGGAGFTLFVCLLITAGTVLPLALVHRWGRIWPSWVVPLAGRDVPRWLVLGPGVFMGAGLCAYFGGGGVIAMLTGATSTGAVIAVEIGGYVAWGVALLVASLSYHRATKPPCASPERVLAPR
ncbi:hypothetical protein [Pseudonocardia sp. TRM90224]|uniref:hypothetical protein n=1 Tax=Pseudonocardia sp. TRM90224 TaxID=2812678 RepID=UPI001E4394C0|nr:hypothetical protein [Pseudonocardia sp. TRM90224]